MAVSKKKDTKWNSSTFCGTVPQKVKPLFECSTFLRENVELFLMFWITWPENCGTVPHFPSKKWNCSNFFRTCSTKSGTVPLCVGLLGYCPNSLFSYILPQYWGRCHVRCSEMLIIPGLMDHELYHIPEYVLQLELGNLIITYLPWYLSSYILFFSF